MLQDKSGVLPAINVRDKSSLLSGGSGEHAGNGLSDQDICFSFSVEGF